MNTKLIVVGVVVLSLVGLSATGLWSLKNFGKTQYQAGYDARITEVSNAEALADIESKKIERLQREKINELEKNLQKSGKLTEKLKKEIRDTEFEHIRVGDSFFRLFNLGTQGGLHPGKLETRLTPSQ